MKKLFLNDTNVDTYSYELFSVLWRIDNNISLRISLYKLKNSNLSLIFLFAKHGKKLIKKQENFN